MADAASGALHHRCTAGQARRRIMENYVDFAQYYLDARRGVQQNNPELDV